MMLGALLWVAVAQQTASQAPGQAPGQAPAKAHIFDGMNDVQMCADLKERVTKTREPAPPVAAQSAAADCRAKRIRGTVAVNAAGEAFDDFILSFVTKARRNICNFERPAMKAFAERGWRYTYIFTSAEGELRSAEVDCS
ncbi:MAG: hypothetical protein AAF291_13275 [Pseudomonadota bacterium]